MTDPARIARRPYWEAMIEFMTARLTEEFATLEKYATGEPAEMSFVVAAHKVYGSFGGDERITRILWDDLHGRMKIVTRFAEIATSLREHRRTGADWAAYADAHVTEAPGLQFAVLAMSTPYRDHPDHPGMYPR